MLPHDTRTLDFSIREEATDGSPVQRQFGDYLLLDEIARGGMGVVYRARQISLNRVVAVKMILPSHMSTPQDRERFRAEAEAAANLDHPGIVPVFQVGEHEEQHYFSMAYIEGRSLEQRLLDGPLNPDEAARMLRTVAEAVHYAHTMRIIHRDLKPSNILLDQEGRPRVTDFGIAKRLAEESHLTATGQIMGTPSFMPPEQAAGHSGQVSIQADVYSLGAILYATLTGRPPFQAATPLETLRQVIEQETVPLRKLNAQVPVDLETIALKCLEKSPGNRYESAQMVADELGRWLEGEPIRARPTTRAEHVRRWCRRNPGLAAAMLTIAGLLLMILIGTFTAAIWLNEARQNAVAAASRAEQAERTRTAELHGALLAQSKALQVSRRPGQRIRSWQALADAARLAPTPELRDEAIACLALVDVQRHRRIWAADRARIDFYWTGFDDSFCRYAIWEKGRGLSVRQVSDNRLIGVLERPDVTPAWVDLAFTTGGKHLLALITNFDGSSELFEWDFSASGAPVVEGRSLRSGPYRRVLALSRDGRQMALLTEDNVIELLSAPDAQLQRRIQLPAGGYFDLAFSPDGEQLALSNRSRRTLEILELATGTQAASQSESPEIEPAEIVRQFRHAEMTDELAWHHDGRLVAIGCYDRNIYVWDVQESRLVSVLQGHTGEGVSVRFAERSDLLISFAWDGTIRLWDPVPGRLLLTTHGQLIEIRDDHLQMALWTREGALELWDILRPDGFRTLHSELIGNRSQRYDFVTPSVDFHPQLPLLVMPGSEGVRLWDLSEPYEKQLPIIPLGRSTGALFTPDGKRLWTQSAAGLQVFGVERPGPPEPAEIPRPAPIRLVEQTIPELAAVTGEKLRIDAAGHNLLFADGPNQRGVVLALSDPEKRTYLGPQPGIEFLEISADGNWVITSGWQEPGPRVWERSSGKLAYAWTFLNSFGCFDAAGHRLFISAAGRKPTVWEVGTWRELDLPVDPHAFVFGFSPDGRYGAMSVWADLDLSVKLFEADSLRVLASLRAPSESFRPDKMIRFSSDSRYLAVCSADHVLYLWDLVALRQHLQSIGLDWESPAGR